MNVERLHAIARAVRRELADQKTPETVERLSNGLQAMIDQPQQPQPQEEVAAALGDLEAQLPDAPSNDYSASWRQTLAELGIEDLLGEGLLEVVTG